MNNWISDENIDINILSNKFLECIKYINNMLTENQYSISNIASGIGDILIYKNNNPNKKIYWNIKHLLDYKPYPDNLLNIKFNIELLLKLFGKDNISNNSILNLILNNLH